MPTFRNFTDTRDGKVYKIVLMPDGKWWSAENLDWDGAGGLYYGNDPSNSFLGRLYPDPNLTGEISPAGSHTPTTSDWNTLISAIGRDNFNRTLRSTFGWYRAQGEDAYGFRVLGGGFGYNNGATWADGGSGIGKAYYTLIRAVAGPGKFSSCDFYTDNRVMAYLSYSVGVSNDLCYSRFIVDIVDPPTTSLSPGKYYTKQKVTLSHPTLPIYYDTI